MGKTVYQIDAFGTTYRGYDWFFKVRDYFHAYVDTASFEPLWAERNSSDGGYKTYENYVFNEPSKTIYSVVKTNNNPIHLDTLAMKGCIYDILTAAFHARNIDYSNIKTK